MKTQQTKTKEIKIDITDLAFGGRGFGRNDHGKAVMVQGALKGETVLAGITREHKDYDQAEVVQILKPSPDRVEPLCPYYANCGGCNLMHLAYPAQVKAKAAWVERALHRVSGIKPHEVISSPASEGCRNRVRVQVKHKKIGFYARASNDLVEISNCLVAKDAINRILPELAKYLEQWQGPDPKEIELLSGLEDTVFACVIFDRSQRVSKQKIQELRAGLLDTGLAGVRFSVAGRLERWEFSPENGANMYRSADLDLFAFPGFFSQVNFATNDILLEELTKEAGEGQGGEALDLYAGTGNFTLPLLRQNWLVTSVENAAGSLDAIVFGAEANGLKQGLAGFQGKVEKVLPVLWEEKAHFDLVVLDPPRSGAKGLMPGLARLDPTKIIYISCHPAALARDAKELIKLGYEPCSFMVFDHFPHTGHVEALLAFEK